MKKNLLLFKVFGIFALALSVFSCNKNTITASFQPTKQVDYFASKSVAKETIGTATTDNQTSTPIVETSEQTTEVAQNTDTKTEVTQKEEKSTEVKSEKSSKIPTLIAKNKEAKKSLLANRANGGDYDGLSIAGFVCGIVGLVALPIVLGILAIVFGAIGLKRTSNGKRGKGFAIAALALGILEVLIIFLLFAILLAFI
jgi:hypothetical protein